MKLITPPGVFRPRSDTWLLADVLTQTLPRGARVLDVCTGSGALAVAAALAGAGEVTAVDVSRRALLATRINARRNGVALRTLRGDLFEPVGDRRFDLVVSNPPYLPSVGDRLPRRGRARAWEGGRDGRALLDRICTAAPRHLRRGGSLLLVHSSVCDPQETVRRLRMEGLAARPVARRRGPLGPLLAARADRLAARGLPLPGGHEELVVIRAVRAAGADGAAAA
ncbi:MAG: HemK2/MTQ2 family protein methyltransferase [Solirubrobacteraceae bacterium]